MRLIEDRLITPDACYGREALFHKARAGVPNPICRAVARPRAPRQDVRV